MNPGDVADFVRAALPPPPARVLEVGAGDGELAAALRGDGYDVLAIDPASEAAEVHRVALHELAEPPASFDAAVAVLSLHHVEPLAESCRRLAALVRPGGTLVVDEFDVERLDEPAVRWWLERRGEDRDPGEVIDGMRRHVHVLRDVLAELDLWFVLEPVLRLPYLYRWNLPPGHREAEAAGIAAGELPLVGLRVTGARAGGPRQAIAGASGSPSSAA